MIHQLWLQLLSSHYPQTNQ